MKDGKNQSNKEKVIDFDFKNWLQFIQLVSKKQLFLSVLLGVLRIVIATIWPFFLYIILKEIGVSSANKIILYFGILLFMFGLLTWFTHLQSKINIRILKSFTLEMIDKIWKKMNSLEWLTFHQKNRVYFFDLLMVETWRLKSGMTALLESLIINTLIAATLSCFVVFVNWSLFLVFFSGLLIMGIGHYFSSKQIRPLLKKFHQAWREQHLWVAKCVDQFDLIKMDRAYESSSKRNIENSSKFLEINAQVLQLQAKWRNINQLLSNLVRIGVFIIGIYWVRIGYLGMDDLLLTLLLISIIQVNIMQIPSALNNLMEAQESFKTISDFFNLKGESSEHLNRIDTFGRLEKITIKNLSYGYENQDVISNFNLNLEVGKIYLWKGKNGSGKSTAAHILLSLIKPDRGNLFINEIEIPWQDLKQFRNRFAFLNQDSPIFMGSIKENILFGHPNSTAALENMHSSWLNRLLPISDMGLLRSVGERGEGLSGGEAKKIALIRETLRSSELLILDEPLNHLDEFSIQEITREVLKIKQNTIVIIISHQNGFESIADKIIEF